MAFKLLPNKVYATNPTSVGIVIFQPVYGNIKLFGSNITKYNTANGKKEIIIPKFEELIPLWDDDMQMDTVNPMNCLTPWIGFTGELDPTWIKPVDPENPEENEEDPVLEWPESVEVWLNAGINEKITPTFELF